MRRLTLLALALSIALPGALRAQQGFTPPKNDKIPVGDIGTNAADVLQSSPRHGEWVSIPTSAVSTGLKAWVMYPERSDKAGVVLVIHDIFGMGDWARAIADQLAKEGFIAIVPDFLSGKGPNGGGSDDLGAQGVGPAIRTLTPADLNARLDAAMAYGKSLPSSNGKTATIGFCWGGTVSFGYAVAQPALSAAAVYYGTPPMVNENGAQVVDKNALKNIKAPVMGFYGGNDNRVTSTVAPTEAAMKELGKSYESHIFDGAGHGFLKSQGTEANYKASEQAWPLTVTFFKKHLQ